MDKHLIKMSDGRTLEVLTEGHTNGKAVIIHHGTPGSAKGWSTWLAPLASGGTFAMAVSRSGYGESERRIGRSFGDNVSDTAELLNHFAIKDVVSIGYSGGGPHAIADTQDSRCRAAIILAGVAPFGDPEFDFSAGMGEENQKEFDAPPENDEIKVEAFEKYAATMKAITGDQVVTTFGGLLSAADIAVFDTEYAEFWAVNLRHAFLMGYYGSWDDDIAIRSPWGFDLETVKVPVELWQGDQDLMVPYSHGKYLNSKIPGSRLIFKPGEGHMSLLVNEQSRIIDAALRYLA